MKNYAFNLGEKWIRMNDSKNEKCNLESKSEYYSDTNWRMFESIESKKAMQNTKIYRIHHRHKKYKGLTIQCETSKCLINKYDNEST